MKRIPYSSSILLMLAFSACKTTTNQEQLPGSSLASVKINDLNKDADYTSLKVVVTEDKESGKVLANETFQRKTDKSETTKPQLTINPGDVVFKLEYFKGDNTTPAYSSEYCDAEDKKRLKKTLVAGSNQIRPIICDKSTKPVPPAEASVDIDPILKTGKDSDEADVNIKPKIGDE